MLRLSFKWSRKFLCEECTKFYLCMDLNIPISLPHFILELFCSAIEFATHEYIGLELFNSKILSKQASKIRFEAALPSG